MKNIHLLPTTKEQHSIIQKHTGLLLVQTPGKHYSGKKLNLYITNDEEIKVGDWFISLYSNSIQKELKLDCTLNKDAYKKIILTTDQSLDGVQAIDDEFLEWFVKNPTCEEVVVNELRFFNPDTNESAHCKWELDIPSEEPKQTDEKGRPMTYWGGLEEPKQETLEEAVKNYCIKKYSVWVSNSDESDDFINGAKWQQERSYSEEDMAESFMACWKANVPEGFECKLSFNEWFEQFKKK